MSGRGLVAGFAVLFLGASVDAAPQPPTPSFPATIEGFASYVGQTTCSPSSKPGTLDFKDFILGTYPVTSNLGIVRACNIGGASEHKEGRAWDWGVNYYNASQRDIAETVIDWLLATDSHGNACALARRTGMMYFIWNSQIWASYRSPNSSCGTAGWKAYTGSNPHTDHVHFSWAWPGANKQTSWWSSPLPANKAPTGYLDGSGCDRVWGWAQDPDVAQSAIDVHLYFGGPAGDANSEGVVVKADQDRDDLCGPLGSCNHAFEVASPLSLHDGQAHAVHAYGIDSAGGPNTQLVQSPATLQCEPTVPAGVKRHVADSTSFEAWGFSYFWDVMPVDDTKLGGIVEGPAAPANPILVRADDGSAEVWLIDGEFRRHVPNPEVFATWGFDVASIVTWAAADVEAFPVGPLLRDRPFLVQGSGSEVYLIDDAPNAAGGAGQGGSSGGWGTGGGLGGEGGTHKGNGQQTRVLEDEGGSCACRAGSAPSSSRSTFAFGLLALGLAMRRRARRGSTPR